MKVILAQDIKNVGKQGDVVEVKDGYARNFLLPRKLALPANEANMKRLEEIRRHQQFKRQKMLEENRLLAEKLAQTPVRLSAKVGEEGKLFGSITNADIAKALKEILGKELDKKKIELSEPIKRAGTYTIPIKLDHDIEATLQVEVVGS
jgi:large subunit ribosomal protein L9